MNIASAKPSFDELAMVPHFGVDVIAPYEEFSAAVFGRLYKEAALSAQDAGKHLIIVGGSGFYLKAMLEGLSQAPECSREIKTQAHERALRREDAYAFIREKDSLYAKNISINDTYRLAKWFEIYLTTSMSASEFFAKHPKKPIIKELPIFEIATPKPLLQERVALRTQKMLQKGLVDEIAWLEARYGREIKPLKAIGLKEVLAYLDGRYDKKQMQERITIHTMQLAKRQKTFNKTQFQGVISKELQSLREEMENVFKS